MYKATLQEERKYLGDTRVFPSLAASSLCLAKGLGEGGILGDWMIGLDDWD